MKLLTYKLFLQERRKSEKIGAQKGLKENERGHRVALDFLEDKNLFNYAVTMTSIPKVGVNPRSKYDTPLGIYFYPAQFYFDTLNENYKLPFQHDAEYINILKINTENRLYIDNMTGIDVAKQIGKLRTLYPEHDSFIEIDWKESSEEAKVPDFDGGQFWYVLYRLSKRIARTTNKQKANVIWNSILRKLGYDVVIDNSAGIIHENEMVQGFFVKADSSVVTMVKRIHNISTDDMTLKNFNTIFHDPKVSDDKKIDLFSQNPTMMRNKIYQNFQKLTSLKHLSDRILKYLIDEATQIQVNTLFMNKKHSFSESIQLLAVSKRPAVLRHIKNPSEQVQLAAVKKEPWSIELIENPTNNVILQVVENDPYHIVDIQNPTDEQLKFIFKNIENSVTRERLVNMFTKKLSWDNTKRKEMKDFVDSLD